MNEMIERVAEAIATQMAADDNDNTSIARAAIKAMRPATLPMIEAGVDGSMKPGNSFFIVTKCWEAMIDAALAQGIVTEGGDAVAAPVSAAN